MKIDPDRSKVLVVGNNYNVITMFKNYGFRVIHDESTLLGRATKDHPDLICFTGGEDVTPLYYREETLSRTRNNPKRDAREGLIFETYLGTPKVGICRGGQFLNVMSGGALWQHVDKHGNDHEMIDFLWSKRSLPVTSTHHQMMIKGDGGYVLGAIKIATEYISANPKREEPEYDPEIIWYPKSKSLCFQPHPEYKLRSRAGDDREAHTKHFFKLIDWAFDLPALKE